MTYKSIGNNLEEIKMKKYILLAILALNCEGATSEQNNSSRMFISKPSLSIGIPLEELIRSNNNFNDIIRERPLTRYPIHDVLDHEVKTRSKSAFSRLKLLSGVERKNNIIEEKLERGPRELAVEYFTEVDAHEALKKTVYDLQEENRRLRELLRFKKD